MAFPPAPHHRGMNAEDFETGTVYIFHPANPEGQEEEMYTVPFSSRFSMPILSFISFISP
jgi:hypothetical protein